MIPKNQLIASALIAGIIVIASSELSLGESTGINILIVNTAFSTSIWDKMGTVSKVG